MNAATEARQSELDRATDSTRPSAELAGELFAVADLLGEQPSLRNALADPTGSDDRRRGLADAVLGTRISAAAAGIVGEAASLRWGTGSRLVAALERQGLRALFAAAHAAGRLDTVEDELFRFSRTVVGNHPLREALDDHSAPVGVRQQLVSDLLAGKADAFTVQLAERAVAAPGRSFELTIDGYLRLAAATRQRQVAVVTVARPLDDEQRERLEAILSRKLDRRLTLQVLVDPSVLGGARIRVGDEVIEGTVAGRLTAAHEQLTT
jgi:F-type H+-transporting ATPase subunit delta